MYYYLNAEKKPTGPHSLAELGTMMQQGELTPATLVAAVGDSSWQPLGNVLMAGSVAAAGQMPPVPGSVPQQGTVACPACTQEMETSAAGMPEHCPHCAAVLHAQQGSLWANFRLAFSRYATFRGRATRKEYWGFVLFYALIFFGLLMGCIITMCYLAAAGACGWGTALSSIGGLYAALVLVFLMPMLGAQVRRLHDVGWSGWWIAGSMGLSILGGVLGGQYSSVWNLATNPVWSYTEQSPQVEQRAMELAAANELDWGSLDARMAAKYRENALAQERLDVMQDYSARQAGITAEMMTGTVVSMVGSIISVLAFVLTLLDSQRGRNKYGDSAKYPLG